MSRLVFDAFEHSYALDGKHVPGVTSLLKPFVDFSMVPPDKLEAARQQGVAVHRMVELDIAGDLDVDGLPEWMGPYYDAWQNFVNDTGFVAIGSEARVYDANLGYAGTLDLVGTMRSKTIAIIDVKRSFAGGCAIGYQLAAYLNAWNHLNPTQKAKQRFALQLRNDGTYRMEPFTDPSDFSVFLALLTIYKAKRKHGIPLF